MSAVSANNHQVGSKENFALEFQLTRTEDTFSLLFGDYYFKYG